MKESIAGDSKSYELSYVNWYGNKYSLNVFIYNI